MENDPIKLLYINIIYYIYYILYIYYIYYIYYIIYIIIYIIYIIYLFVTENRYGIFHVPTYECFALLPQHLTLYAEVDCIFICNRFFNFFCRETRQEAALQWSLWDLKNA